MSGDKEIFAHVAGRVEHHVAHYWKAVAGAAFTSVVRATIPGTPLKSPTGVKSPTKKDVAALKKRIVSNVLGNGVLPSAVPNAYGQPVSYAFAEGSPTAMPLVVNRAKKPVPGMLTTVPQVLAHLKKNTLFKRRGSVKLRERTARGKLAFVTAGAWRGAARALSLRAGNFVFGWSRAAEAIQSSSVRRTVLSNGTYTGNGAVISHSQTSLEAENTSAPSADLKRYSREVLGKRMRDEQVYFRDRFRKFMLRAIKQDFRRA